MSKWMVVALVLVPSFSFAASWKRADAPFSRTRLVMSSSTDSGVGLYTKGKLLKVGPQAPSGRSSISSTMVGDIEISVNKKAGTTIPEEKKGAVLGTTKGDLAGVAYGLQQKGIGKIVRQLKDGSYVLDTSK